MNDSTLGKTYDPREIERALYDAWEREGRFAPAGTGAPFCIMIPPPNVTGNLHMGHAFQQTIMDALTRYHRMRGDNTLWQAGTDHAGIATQMVVERQLEAEGRTRHDLGREAFIERVWSWKAHSGGTITRQLRRLGASLDWSRERFTMDEGLSSAVREVFVRLYDEGLIYRGKRLVNWDPVLHTAVSDLEVVSEEESGHLWHIRYPYADGSGHLTVATTRPETLLGDSAVAVHPDDPRYAGLVGREVQLPLTGRTIPVIADAYVDPEFGSGCVKITPAHDFNDYEVWSRHRDEPALASQPFGGLINIFTADARIKAQAADDGARATDDAPATVELLPAAYRGLDRFAARKKLVADLEAAGLLDKTEPHKLMVPRGDRSQAVIEPYLTDQWFVRAGPLAEPAIRAVEDGRIRFVPENWSRTYFEWMRNIQDWCISRQIWWGHRIPAWYDPDGAVYVGRDEAEVRSRHGLAADVALTQDDDVLDTWFSSALWPFSTLGWPEKTDALATWYPTSVLVTGFDIIFFWVARMIMMGLHFMDDVPFRDVYIHGLVRDAEGQKMSKSKGNILDPLDLIDGIDLESLVAKRTTGLMQPGMAPRIERATRKEFPGGIPSFGADALRFTFASLATQSRDIRFDLGRIEGYRNFCNKLWNATRFVLMNTRGQDCGLEGEVELAAADRWVISRLQEVEAEVDAAIGEYRFDQAAQAMYGFIWDEYCSWYLELSKVALNDPDSPPARLRGTRRTLLRVLEALLRLAHPIIPFITEALWREVAPLTGRRGATIMQEPWPRADDARIDREAIEETGWVMALVSAVRNIRGEMNIRPDARLPVLLEGGDAVARARLERHLPLLRALARVDTAEWLEPGAHAPEAATALAAGLKVLVPLGSFIDAGAECARLDKEIARLESEHERTAAKLANDNFVARAPAAVVDKERNRLADLADSLASLRAQRERMDALRG